jgi:hypothetical protein
MITKSLKKVGNSTISSLFAGIVVIMAMFMVVGCDEKEAVEIKPDVYKNFGKFTKEITVYDESKENSAVILIGSDDESIVKMWETENFTLVPIKEGEEVEEVVNRFFAKNAVEEKSNTVESNVVESDEITAKISIRFLSKNFTNDVSNFFLSTNDPYDEDLRAGWILETIHSDEYGHVGQNIYNRVTCTVYGQNFWHRGYYKVEFLETWGNSFFQWLTSPDNAWVEIEDNDDPIPFYRNPCYTMVAHRKYKGTPNSVVCVFSY